MDEQKMEGDGQDTVHNHPQPSYEVSEQDIVHNYSKKACEVSEQAFNEPVEDFSQETRLIDFDTDELNAMCEEFLHFVASTYYTSIETSIGRLYLAYSGHRLQFVSLEEKAIFLEKAEKFLGTQPILDEDRHLPVEMIERVRATVESHVVYDEPIDLSRLTNFEKTVLKHVRYILPGEVCSYEALAQVIGQPDAVDEIARVIANNPFPVVVPCHRVVKSDRHLDDYCSGGIAAKKRLLEREGVSIQGNYAARSEEELEMIQAVEKKTSHPPKKPQEALRNYLEWLITRYKHIRTQEAFPGVDFVEFAEIYTPQQFVVSPTSANRQTSKGQGALSWLEDEPEERQEREQGLENIIQHHNYIVILGEPGSGKTTMLRHLALTYAKQMRANLRHGYNYDQQLLPIPLQLVDYVQSGMLVGDLLRDFLVDYFKRHGCPTEGLAEVLETAFDTGRCLVLLDGLDEVGPMQQQIKLVRQINRFVSHYSHPNNRFVVTSRITGYYQYLAKPFVYCTIQGMDYKTVEQFLQRWIDVVEIGKEFSSKWTPDSSSSRRGREKQLLETTLQRLVRMTHSRITYSSDDSCQSWKSITPLLVQVVVIIYYTLVQQKGLCFELAQWTIDIADEADMDHNRQYSYSVHDYLVSLFSEEIHKHYLDRHIKNCDKATGDEQECTERISLSGNDGLEYQSEDIKERSADKPCSQKPPSTAVEDIINFLFKNPDEPTKTIVKQLYIDAHEQAYKIIAQSRGVMATAR